MLRGLRSFPLHSPKFSESINFVVTEGYGLLDAERRLERYALGKFFLPLTLIIRSAHSSESGKETHDDILGIPNYTLCFSPKTYGSCRPERRCQHYFLVVGLAHIYLMPPQRKKGRR